MANAVMGLAKLDAFPPFLDEASYVRWAVRMAEAPSPTTLWLPLTEDWQAPLFIWMTTLAHGAIDDPMLAGRLVAALSGPLTVALVFHIGWRLIGAWPAAIAASIMSVFPAFIFTSRLALADAPLVMLTALIWALSLRAVHGRRRWAVSAGVAVGIAFWIKLSGILLLVIPITGLLLAGRTTLRRRAATLALCIAPAAAACLAFLLGPTSAQVLERAAGSVNTPGQLTTGPVVQWTENLRQMGGWAQAYLPTASMVAAAGAIGLPFVTRRRDDWWLWSVLVFWLAFHAMVGTTLFSRYMLPALVPLALLTARAIAATGDALHRADRDRLASIWIVSASAAVVISLAIPAIALVLAPTRAALAPDDRAQYIEEWPAGFGQVDALQWIADTTAAEPGPAIVLTNHFLGAPRDLAALTFRNRPDVVVYVENRIRHPARGAADAWRGHGVPVYALINGNQDDGAEFLRLNPEFTQAAAFERPGGKTSVRVLEFRPE